MEPIRFVFWEGVKVLALVVLGMVSAKSISSLVMAKTWIKPVLYGVILVLVGLGALEAGNDVAAEIYMWSSDSNLARGDAARAYTNAERAVSLRPNNVSYWHSLIAAKMHLSQFQSVLDDEPSMRALSGGDLDEVDEYQFALCSYFLGQYDNVVATTLRLIRESPSYAAPYVLEGLAYTAEKKYAQSEQSFLAVLQIFPNNQAAVEGLARAYYLDGDRRRALATLDETAKYEFSPPARDRIQALRGLYEQ